MFNPADSFWFVGDDDTRVYSSRLNTYVSAESQVYVGWCDGGARRASKIASEAELWFYIRDLQPAWMFDGATFAQPSAGEYTKVQLRALSAVKQAELMATGVDVDLGEAGKVHCSTDPVSLTLLQGAASLARTEKRRKFQWVDKAGQNRELSGAQIIALEARVADFVQSTFETQARAVSAINEGADTSPEAVMARFA